MIDQFINCHEEPIHILGKITSDGYLLGVDLSNNQIDFFSSNLSTLFPIVGDTLLQSNILDFIQQNILKKSIGFPAWSSLKQQVEKQQYVYTIILGNNPYYLISHILDHRLYLEFLHRTFSSPQQNYLQACQAILSAPRETQIWETLCAQIRQISLYDRVMVYQFLYDGSGQVIAEDKEKDLDSYLDLHYPESDIPSQARALYLKNKFRMVADVDDLGISIISRQTKAVDLTYAVLRRLSPTHLQYLKNAGIESSFSISIIVQDQLWGLITCHAQQSKMIDFTHQKEAMTLTTLAVNAYESLQAQRHIQNLEQSHNLALTIQKELLTYKDPAVCLDRHLPAIAKLANASGAAICGLHHSLYTGETPTQNTIEKIYTWALREMPGNIYANHEFFLQYQSELQLDYQAAGILIIRPDAQSNNLLMWFGKEIIQTIHWAGKPDKNISLHKKGQQQVLHISPRSSFERWTEEVSGTARPWTEEEIVLCTKFVQLIRDSLLVHSEKIDELQHQIQEITEELQSFSYALSHDLNTPLAVIRLNAQMLQRSNAKDEKGILRLSNIVNEIDSISDMTKGILNLSKTKSTQLRLEDIDPRNLIQKIVEDAQMAYHAQHCSVELQNIQVIYADKTMLHQVFMNIIGNAIKYSSKKEAPLVRISAQEQEETICYAIADNGIGIAQEEGDKLFKIFSRLENAKEFNGNGIGLSIVYKIMQRLGGKIIYSSEAGKGTTFYLYFKKRNPDK